MNKVLLSLLLAAPTLVSAQSPGTAKWEASLLSPNNQDLLVVRLTATLEKGWHIYAQSQPPGGPNPLRISIEPGTPYELAGVITGTKPKKLHDASFDLETQFYTDVFTLKVLVKANSATTGGVPLAVRFQMCSDTTCMPPKTVHLIAMTTATSAPFVK